MPGVATTDRPATEIGDLLRFWRGRRRLSQLDLALDAAVSAKHLSFVETGRARPSRQLLVHLADRLELPLNERNRLLLAGGFAPFHRHAPDPRETRRLQTSLEQLLAAHHPNPALVIDAEWNLVAANSAAAVLWEGVDATLLEGTVNVLRVVCHPDGLPRTAIVSPACSAGLLRRLRRQASDREDDALLDLVAEMEAHLAERGVDPAALAGTPGGGVAAPITLRTRAGDVRLLTVIATLGAPFEVTAGDLALETFLPVDAESAARLARVTPMVISDPAPMTESSCNFSWSSVPGVAV